MVTAAGQSSGSSSVSASSGGEATDTPPVIQINGDNPAVIQVGASYADLGATITGPAADLNLGIKTFVNGLFVSNIQLDTSAAATDTSTMSHRQPRPYEHLYSYRHSGAGDRHAALAIVRREFDCGDFFRLAVINPNPRAGG